MNIGKPISLVESNNIGRVASLTDNMLNSLVLSMYLCKVVKVVLTKNYSNVELLNRLTEIIKELIYNISNLRLGLPIFIFINFDT